MGVEGGSRVKREGVLGRECWICRRRSKAVSLVYIHPPAISPTSSAQVYH